MIALSCRGEKEGGERGGGMFTMIHCLAGDDEEEKIDIAFC